MLDLSDIFSIYNLVEAFWLVIPAYGANGMVPLICSFIKKKHRLDFGRNFFDGRPLLGTGKTIEGLLIGSIVGALIAVFMQFAFPYLPWSLSDRPLAIAPVGALTGFLLGLGSMVGDAVGSFFKRRLNLERGRPAPLLDQLDFLFGALAFAMLAVAMKLEWVILLAVITPLIHWFACIIGYLLKIKKEPW